MFDRLLVANRGEIAARIITTARGMGIETVAVHAADDADQPHVRLADHAVDLGAGPPASTYLAREAIVEAAVDHGCDAVHPGYGFLSENPAMARAVGSAGLSWVGPSPHALELLGDKARALSLARELGLPTTPGSDGRVESAEAAVAAVERIGLPAVVKAVHGGGGMGMVRVQHLDDVPTAWEAARDQAKGAFGSPQVLVERWWERPRHVEVQVAFDAQGNGVHLFERECSIQRRHQKLVEEAPAPGVDDDLRDALTAQALALCEAAGVVNLATVEFLVTDEGHVFNEVNPRLQVEHPVTELVTGQDLVAWQLQLAAGRGLPRGQDQLSLEGWAVEARVNVEDPLQAFTPAPGPVGAVHVPAGQGVRIDHALVPGGRVAAQYDSLVAKVIAHGPDRETALDRCRNALVELGIEGPPTTAGFLAHLIDQAAVREGRLHTGLLEEGFVEGYRALVHGAMATAVAATAVGDRGMVHLGPHLAAWENDGGRVLIEGVPAEPRGQIACANEVVVGGQRLRSLVVPEVVRRVAGSGATAASIASPLAGVVAEVLVQPGQAVAHGEELLVIEAMKMKNRITATRAGTVAEVLVEPGASVSSGDELVVLEE